LYERAQDMIDQRIRHQRRVEDNLRSAGWKIKTNSNHTHRLDDLDEQQIKDLYQMFHTYTPVADDSNDIDCTTSLVVLRARNNRHELENKEEIRTLSFLSFLEAFNIPDPIETGALPVDIQQVANSLGVETLNIKRGPLFVTTHVWSMFASLMQMMNLSVEEDVSPSQETSAIRRLLFHKVRTVLSDKFKSEDGRGWNPFIYFNTGVPLKVCRCTIEQQVEGDVIHPFTGDTVPFKVYFEELCSKDVFSAFIGRPLHKFRDEEMTYDILFQIMRELLKSEYGLSMSYRKRGRWATVSLGTPVSTKDKRRATSVIKKLGLAWEMAHFNCVVNDKDDLVSSCEVITSANQV
jgi:hypothetical protein